MNDCLVPTEPLAATQPATDRRATSAIVTPSYGPDFERCRLLCETLDRFVTGFDRHYLLVEHRDVALFRSLESPRRIVVDERDLLPRCLVPINDPLSGFKRRLWLSPWTMPLRGWHAQQLRRRVGHELLNERGLGRERFPFLLGHVFQLRRQAAVLVKHRLHHDRIRRPLDHFVAQLVQSHLCRGIKALGMEQYRTSPQAEHQQCDQTSHFHACRIGTANDALRNKTQLQPHGFTPSRP